MILDNFVKPNLVKDFTSTYFSEKINHDFKSLNFSMIKDEWFGGQYVSMIRHYDHAFFDNHTNNHITINRFLILDKDFSIIKTKIFYPLIKQTKNTITGVEDIRLIKHNNELYYYGNTKTGVLKHKNTPSGLPIKIGVQLSRFDINLDYLENDNIINPTHIEQQDIEKNWSHINILDKSYFIYGWNPIVVSELDIENKNLNKLKEFSCDNLKKFRGSTNGIVIDDEIWFLIHSTERGRNYFHKFAIFDMELNPIKHSSSFKFDNNKIEFCLSMVKRDDNILICYSYDDNSTILKEYNVEKIKKSLIWFNI